MEIKFLQAFNGDSIWISLKDFNGTKRNILIDGGRSDTFYDPLRGNGPLKKAIDHIKKNGEKIDLLVLSHIDNDHIEGLLKWFEIDKEAPKLIKEMWFNSGRSIATYFKEEINKDLDITLKHPDPLTGVTEGLELEKYLLENKLWEGKIIKKGFEWKNFGLNIQILTPTKSQLKKLLKEYKDKTGDPIYTGTTGPDWNRNIKTIIQEESLEGYNFESDRSKKNASSITMLITYSGKKFLFLADSHPKEVYKSLIELGVSNKNPIELDFMQISHHGSKKNTNKELLDVIKTNQYVISTNGATHYHPHKALISRIAERNPSATIYLNYQNVLNSVLTPDDKVDFPNLITSLIPKYVVT